MNNIQSGISARLKALRESNGLTQKEAGDLLGVTPAAYGKIESGDRGLSSEYCIALADHFGVSCDFILRGVSAELANILTSTYLSPETINVLVEDRKKIEVFEATYRSPYEDECDDPEECAIVRREELEGLALFHKTRYYILNALLRDEAFRLDLEYSGLKMLYSAYKLRDLPQDLSNAETDENTDLWNASEYSAVRAFMRFIERLRTDENFLTILDGF